MRPAVALLFAMAAARAVPAHPDATFHALYLGSAENTASIAVQENGKPQISLPVPDPAVQSQIKDKIQPGDRVTLTVNAGSVVQIGPETVQVSAWDRIVTIAGCLAIHVIFGFVLLGRKFKNLLIGQDNRYSNSKCQMAFWFGILAVTYLSTSFLRWAVSGYTPGFAGGVDLPKNLLLLSGISVFSFGAAKGITTQKQAAAAAAAPQRVAVVAAGGAGGEAVAVAQLPTPPAPPVKTSAAQPRFPDDLLRDDAGNPDLGDYQMLAVTAIAVAVYLTQIFGFLGSIQLLHHVTIPDVDSTILATFGLGQGAYLVKKQLGD